MTKLAAKFGFVVEADSPGFFYNRIGQWTQYGSAAEGYIWSEDEAVAIRECAKGAKGAWPLTPKLVHPAVYDDNLGITVITGKPTLIDSLVGVSVLASSPGALAVPNAGGIKFDVKAAAGKLGVNMMGGAMHSL